MTATVNEVQRPARLLTWTVDDTAAADAGWYAVLEGIGCYYGAYLSEPGGIIPDDAGPPVASKAAARAWCEEDSRRRTAVTA